MNERLRVCVCINLPIYHLHIACPSPIRQYPMRHPSVHQPMYLQSIHMRIICVAQDLIMAELPGESGAGPSCKVAIDGLKELAGDVSFSSSSAANMDMPHGVLSITKKAMAGVPIDPQLQAVVFYGEFWKQLFSVVAYGSGDATQRGQEATGCRWVFELG